MRQSNGCSTTPALRSRAAKQWFEELAQKMKKNFIATHIEQGENGWSKYF